MAADLGIVLSQVLGFDLLAVLAVGSPSKFCKCLLAHLARVPNLGSGGTVGYRALM
jgi:hypothetical protein